MGWAAAMSVVLFLIVFVISLVQTRLLRTAVGVLRWRRRPIGPSRSSLRRLGPVGQRRAASHRAGRVSLYVVLAILGVIAALPFVWMILSSFKTEAEVRQIPPTFFPAHPSLDNYRTILGDPELPLATFYRNSAFVAVANTIATLFTASILGYVFAKFEFRWKMPMFWFILATMMIPEQVTMLPALPDPAPARPAQQPVGVGRSRRSSMPSRSS